MIAVIPSSFFIESQSMRETDAEQQRTEGTRIRKQFPKAKSCIVDFSSVSVVRAGKRRVTDFPSPPCSTSNDASRHYKSVILAGDKPIQDINDRSPDSGLSRNSSMVVCLASRFHSVPTFQDESSRDGCTYLASERRPRSHQSQAISGRSVRSRNERLTGSSVILSDYDSSVQLCRSCNTFYEVPVPCAGTCEPPEQLQYKDLDIPTKICNVFWKLQLMLNSFSCGNDPVDFWTLWPSEQCLEKTLLELCSMSSALVQTLSKFVTMCGPQHVLKALLSLKVISVNQTFENGFGLLHIACIAQNSEAVSFLTKTAAINPSIRDMQGCTAAQVCCSQQIYSLLPSIYHSPSGTPKMKKLPPALLEKQKIFEMARSAAEAERLLMQLQMLEFDVNKEMDNTGDLLIHVVIKEGLSQVPLLLLLVKLCKADVNRPNRSGLTCLMLAASMGVTVLVDLLLCVLGANPDACCQERRWTALHFACYEQHLDTINVLLKRGADFNMEDENGARADDIALKYGVQDCCHVITQKRQEHIRKIKTLVRENKLGDLKRMKSSDFFAVSNSGHTPIMWAVKEDRLEILEFLLNQVKVQTEQDKLKHRRERPAFIDAQLRKTLRTALALAVIHRKQNALALLMRYGANPSIGDMQNLLPLHHAVLKEDVEMVKALLQFRSALTRLPDAIALTQNEEIIVQLKAACNWRQNTIVNPELFEQSVSGNTNRLYCILEEGDSVNPFSGVGDWPMYLAAVNGHLSIIKLFLQHKGDFWSVHSSNGNTALHVACSNNHKEIVEFLIAKYKETEETSTLLRDHLNLFNFNARTPLMLAAEAGNLSLVHLLLEHGASTSVLTPSGEIFSCDLFAGVQYVLEQHHKLHCADVFEAVGDKKGLQRLVAVFLPFHDHNLRDPGTGDSPLMMAALLGKIESLEFLLRSSSYTLFRKTGFSKSLTNIGFPAIDVDDDSSDLCGEDIKGTLAEGVDVPAAFDETKRLSGEGFVLDAHLSALLGNMKTVCQQNPVLFGNEISQTCAVNVSDKCTVFHRVIENGDSVAMLDRLLDADRSAVNMQDSRGFSPLHLAVHLNRKKIVQRLIGLPYVDLNCRALDGSLPEDLTVIKAVKSLVLRARGQQDASLPRCLLQSVANSLSGADRSVSHASEPINFDHLNTRFAMLKERCQATFHV